MTQTARIILGDNRETLKTLPDGIAQTCVTSPPYWGLRDYGTSTWVGGEDSCEHIKDRSKTKSFGNPDFNANRPSREATKTKGYYFEEVCELCGATREDSQIGLEQSAEEYVEQLCLVFDEVRRVLSEDGTLWLNLGDSYANKSLTGIPWMVAFALKDRGWYLRSEIIWAKPNPMPESITDRPTKSHEHIFLMAKSPRYYYNHEAIKEPVTTDIGDAQIRFGGSKYGDSDDPKHQTKSGNVYVPSETRNKRDVWTVATKPYSGAHFAVYPTALVTPCVLAGSREGDTVLDPFSGSGTTGVVALQNGRNYIGTELNPEYADISERRIAEAIGLLGTVELVERIAT